MALEHSIATIQQLVLVEALGYLGSLESSWPPDGLVGNQAAADDLQLSSITSSSQVALTSGALGSPEVRDGRAHELAESPAEAWSAANLDVLHARPSVSGGAGFAHAGRLKLASSFILHLFPFVRVVLLDLLESQLVKGEAESDGEYFG